MAGENRDLREIVILIKGAGEMATGVAHRLFRSGFRLCLTEIAEPLAVRRGVSFCEAVFEKEKAVEGVTARLVQGKDAILRAWGEGWIPVVIDPVAAIGRSIHPHVIIDAILAKKNTGTSMTEAPLVIGLGPGFRAGGDVHLVVETNRGHNLGRVIERGEAEPDTGIPGDIRGYTTERVLRAPAQGRIRTKKQIGDSVEAGEEVAEIDGMPIRTKISGVLRGILRDGTHVQEKMKTGDIDPRGARESCFTISEKARAIGGGVLEAILMRYNR
jgi:xanthine dehydrogenase accessory factor